MPFQVGKIKKGQRLFSNAGSASMGYELPAAIGAAVASEKNNRVICLAGDGSIQMNLQELQTIKHYNLNILIFVINNNGYLSIRTTQKNFFNSNFIGESNDSGISFPEIENISKAYGFMFFKCEKDNFENQLNKILSTKGPIMCEVIVDPTQGIEPRLSSKQNSDGSISSPPLEDMYPFLSSDELNSIMMIKSKIRIND
jgi:acetolactate synthase-1/2/3 large subunit